MKVQENIYQFIDVPRVEPAKKPLLERRKSFAEIYDAFTDTQAATQADRCLACGNPYCQHSCPIHNNIPDWLRLAREGRLIEAAELAHLTNSLPEVCGRVCPQDRLCEGACTLNQEFGAVTIGSIEKYITEAAFAQGWRPHVLANAIPQHIAVVGAGPAGLSCADVLIRHGAHVTVFDSHKEIGGLLTFGIPAFKLEKSVMQFRRKVFSQMGIEFKLNTTIGQDIHLSDLVDKYDAVFLGMGTYQGIKANIPNEDAEGVFSALPFLIYNTQALMGNADDRFINVADKRVLVLGGGDTAMDCVRTALRQGAKTVSCVYRRDEANMPGSRKEIQNAKEEGSQFTFNTQPSAVEVHVKALGIETNADKKVTGLRVVHTKMTEADETGRQKAAVIPHSEEVIACDIVLIAFGFAPSPYDWLSPFGVKTDHKGRIITSGTFAQQTAHPKIFAGGDITRGSDLVVTAIGEGRRAALGILAYLGFE